MLQDASKGVVRAEKAQGPCAHVQGHDGTWKVFREVLFTLGSSVG